MTVDSQTDAAIARKNMRWGWALFGLFWVLFGGTVGVAFIYLWLTRRHAVFITELGPGPPGRRLAVKDLFDTAGIRTTYGSAVFADHVPAQSATWVRLLEEAGWTNVGKTNLHEFAYGVTSQNLHYGVVPNPCVPGPHGRRLERRLGGGDRARTWPTARSGPTPAARSASRPRAAGSPGSSRRTGSSRSTACSRSPRPSTTPGRWPATSPAASS